MGARSQKVSKIISDWERAGCWRTQNITLYSCLLARIKS